jgi:hypothetical protein
MKSPGRGMPGHFEEPRYRKTLPKGVDTYGLQSVSVLVRAQRLPDQPWKPRHGRGFGADGFDGFVLRRKNALQLLGLHTNNWPTTSAPASAGGDGGRRSPELPAQRSHALSAPTRRLPDDGPGPVTTHRWPARLASYLGHDLQQGIGSD